MKKILFYYPSNKRSVQIETTLKVLKNHGYEVLVLTTIEKGKLHMALEQMGIETHVHLVSKSNAIRYYWQQIRYLAKFCKQHQVDIVYGNLQHANFIAVFAQFLMKSKVVAFRHHFKFSQGNFNIPLTINRNEKLFDKIINRLAKHVVVPSDGVYQGILKHENIHPSKLSIIPYMYDFSTYGKPNANNVEAIKNQYKARLRIIMVARLIPFKRHILIFPVIKKLIAEGFDIQLLVLDEGPEKDRLDQYIQDHQLTDKIHMLGFRTDFLDYMNACDLIIHPSITEASNSVIKEIGLQKKVVAVCQGVGDFDEYIIDKENGYLMDISNPQLDAEIIIKEIYHKPELIEEMGEKIQHTIRQKFGHNDEILKQYIALFESV